MSWNDLIALRDRLDGTLQHIRDSRALTRPSTSTKCPGCGAPMVQGAASVSVRATILALGRCAITSEPEAKLLEKRWKKYRQATGCDAHGKQRSKRMEATALSRP